MNTLLQRQDQVRMLEGALFWLNNHIEEFITPKEDTIASSDPEHIKPDLSRKAFTELGLALRLAQRSPALKHHPDLAQLQQAWLDILHQQNFFYDIRRRVQLFPHRIIAYATMRSFGLDDEHVHKNLQIVMNRHYMDRVERSAWEKLDMKYYIQAAGLQEEFPSYQALLDGCSLNQLPSLSYVQNFDLYGLTHLLFHFSDFGAVDMRLFLGDIYQQVQDYVDLSLTMCLLQQDWDLVTELLINQYCLGKQFSALDKDTAQALQGIQQPAGFIPGRNWVQAQHSNNPPDKTEHCFADVYHPTVLALFLMICELAE